jgi:hypothetical protein
VRPKQPLHGGALHALAASVDQPYLLKSRRARGVQILIHYRNDIPGRKAVKIDRVFDRDFDARLVIA